jgi:hypothetical protein
MSRSLRHLRPVLALLALALSAPAVSAQVPTRLSPAEFAELGKRLSEPPGFFDTDNLVTNEDSYLHAVSGLAAHGVRGGVYLGVGPDQNFSYIAALRPSMAFILDIRTDNRREHLLFKALFAEGRTRIEFLALLFGRAVPRDAEAWRTRDVDALLEYLERTPGTIATAEQARQRVRAAAVKSGIPWSLQDLETIRRFHAAFMTEGPAMRLRTFGRPERLDYPTYGELLRQKDRDGRQASYLATEDAYQFVRDLQERHLIVPVVGDFAGPRALRSIGDYVSDRRERVSAFYASNVEQYLFDDGRFQRFVENVRALPRDSASVIIRSYFPYGRPHPQAVPGYLSVQLLQRMDAFLQAGAGYASYQDLVNDRMLP